MSTVHHDITACKEPRTLAACHRKVERRIAERTAQLTAVNAELTQEGNEASATGDELSRANARMHRDPGEHHGRVSAWDREFRFTYVNARAAQPTPRDVQRPTHRPIRVGPVSRQAWAPRSTASASKPWRSECPSTSRRRPPTGGTRTVSIPRRKAYPSIGRDHRAQRVEVTLRRSEAYLAEAQRLSHTGSAAWKVSTGDAFWSDETYRIYGFAPGTEDRRLSCSSESFTRRIGCGWSRPDKSVVVQRQAGRPGVSNRASG